VDCQTDTEKIVNFMQHAWGMQLPKLLISVVGGGMHFRIDEELKDILIQGFVQAAKSTGRHYTVGDV